MTDIGLPYSIEHVAYHEAGHALIAMDNEQRFKYVTIISGENYLGCVVGCRWPRGVWEVLEHDRPTPNMRNRIERRISMVLAGPIAESRISGQEPDDSEYWTACDLLSRMCGSARETEAYLNLLHIRTEQHLSRRLVWPCVSALAEQLLERETMTYDEVRRYCDETRRQLIAQHSEILAQVDLESSAA